MLFARFDGGCDANPGGNGACACRITDHNRQQVYLSSRYLGCGPKMSNNVAEFAGALLILEWLRDNDVTQHINIVGDSQTVIRRMKKWRIRKKMNGLYVPMAERCLAIIPSLKCPIVWSWQPRQHNRLCDQLCDEVLRKAREPQRLEREAWLDVVARDRRSADSNIGVEDAPKKS